MKIIILNFETAEVHIYPYDETLWEDCVEFIESKKINSSNCQWMTTDNLNIQIH